VHRDAADGAPLAILVRMQTEEPGGVEQPAGQHTSAHEIAERIRAAAIEAEFQTGHREATEEEARRGVILRLVRMIGGFMLIGAGVAALVLPGPGWLLIVLGLGLLPFAWAERTIRLIRRRIPGVPEDGNIPVSTWIIMGVLVVGAAAGSFFFGEAVTNWVAELWGDPDKLLT
jgi:hypothetical protein